MAGYESFQLKNGVKAVLVSLPGLSSVTVEVLVKIGSKYEKKGEYGISHFLEHMAFKGTKKRVDATAIHNEIDAKGAVHNAGTGFEYTSYYIKTVEQNVPWALEMLGDILANSTMPANEVKKEAGVIAEEIKMYEDNPTMGLSSDFAKLMFRDLGVGCWNISGEVDDVAHIGRQQLVDYRDKYLNANGMVVVVAGDINKSLKSQVSSKKSN